MQIALHLIQAQTDFIAAAQGSLILLCALGIEGYSRHLGKSSRLIGWMELSTITDGPKKASDFSVKEKTQQVSRHVMKFNETWWMYQISSRLIGDFFGRCSVLFDQEIQNSNDSIPKKWPNSLNSENHLGSFNINFHLRFPILSVDFTLRLLSPGLSLSRTPGPCSSCSSLQCASQSVQLRTREKNQIAGGKRKADC